MKPRLSISLMGSFQAGLEGEAALRFEYDKVRALLAYLAVEAGVPQRRDTLTGLLWPDQPDRAARHSLSQALLALRQALGDPGAAFPFVLADRTTVQLDPEAETWLDVAEFDALLAACAAHEHAQAATCTACMERRRRAAELYRGEFLKGLSAGDSLGFEEWMTVQRERLHRLALEALYELARYHEWRGELDQAQAYARRQVELEPWREEAHRQLMRLLAHSGQRSAALAQYAACRRALADEFGMEPSAETARLVERIRGADRAPGQNLPSQPTPFLGRQEEVAEIAGMLAHPDCRALTILGPGGMGKTRLALHVAQSSADRFLDGIYFIPLAVLETAHQMVTGIAEALEFSFNKSRDPQAQLLDYLRGKEALLVLDSFEHLQDGADLVAEILKSAPEVKALITSRARLNLSWEWAFELEGLAVPGDVPWRMPSTAEDEPGEGDGLSSFSAVQLFVHSARRARHRFELTPADAPAVARICRLVEGMPLALELAASWVRALAPGEIAAEIERGLDVLATSATDMPQRHRSMRAVFDHSWRLLAADEQAALRSLSVFRGGFSREAAGQVAGTRLPVLAALVDKSLLRGDPSGRYDMHELLRQYAAEKPDEMPGEKEKLLDRHAAYYAAFLKGQEEPLRGAGREAALAGMDRDIENLRLAWRWLAAPVRARGLEECLEALYLFYDWRGWLREGEEAFSLAAEALAGGEKTAQTELTLARVTTRQTRFCLQLANYEKARGLLQASLPSLRRVEARSEIAFALGQLGEVESRTGAYEPAEGLLRESLALYEEMNDTRGMASTLNQMGAVIHNQGRYLDARGYYEKSLAIFREVGDRWGIAAALHSLGHVAYELGEYQAARRTHEESLAIKRELGDRWGISGSLNLLGIVWYALGEYTEAERCLLESLALRWELGNRWGAAATLNNLGQVAFAQGAYAQARQRCTESLAIYREVGDQRGIALALHNLGEVALAQAAHAEAETYYLESLAISQEIGHAAGMAYALHSLGEVSQALEAYPAAGDYYRRALQVAVDTHAAPRALDALLGAASLLARGGERERAVELLALVRAHPASEKTSQERAARLLAELASHLPGDLAAAAMERGEAAGWEAAARALLSTPSI